MTHFKTVKMPKPTKNLLDRLASDISGMDTPLRACYSDLHREHLSPAIIKAVGQAAEGLLKLDRALLREGF